MLSFPIMDAMANGPASGMCIRGDDHPARIGYATLQSVHAYVRTQERYVVSGVYHHPDVGMDGVEWGSRRHMYVNPDHHGVMTVR
ncbi:MAG: hypothetical protein ACLR14_12575 [Phocaeicola vulgatus]